VAIELTSDQRRESIQSLRRFFQEEMEQDSGRGGSGA
jgi:hypothetical protein